MTSMYLAPSLDLLGEGQKMHLVYGNWFHKYQGTPPVEDIYDGMVWQSHTNHTVSPPLCASTNYLVGPQ